MSNPYDVLGLPAECDDETIRRRYLELVKRFPPEQHPDRFVAIRAAYESLRNRETRLEHRLFEAGKQETVTAIIEEIECRSSRPRLTLEALLGRAPESLTPQAIDAVLAEFRAWLEQGAGAAPADSTAPAPTAPDLHTLLGQMTALRHEVNLQTKATRTQQEQGAEAIRVLGQAVDQLRETEPDPAEQADAVLRPVLKSLVDVSDALALARRELQRSRQAVEETLEELTRAPSAPTPGEGPARKRRFFEPLCARLCGWNPPAQVVAAPDSKSSAALTERVQRLLDSLITGYIMSLQRLEKTLLQHGLERLNCAGEPFDPERMEVVEAVADSSLPPGRVVDEVRPGYLWRGRVFRYAQVRVARPEK